SGAQPCSRAHDRASWAESAPAATLRKMFGSDHRLEKQSGVGRSVPLSHQIELGTPSNRALGKADAMRSSERSQNHLSMCLPAVSRSSSYPVGTARRTSLRIRTKP